MSFVVSPEPPKDGEVLPDVENNPQIEKQWAIAAYDYSRAFMNLITTLKDHKSIKLTNIDDDIYLDFRDTFPDMKVNVFSEDEMKSEESKLKWRPFMLRYEKRLDDFNILTLLRIDCEKDYTEDNSCVVPRIQFYSIEVARLRGAYNAKIQQKSINNPKKCFVCGENNIPLKICSRCRFAFYCSAECQKKDWMWHKLNCK